ncbi:MAG: hypothetical protein OEV59_01470 [Deltaproteobacteria bacterium]|nr:hypothetical protein [Deltaproteobacteria bacterium]
MIRKILAALVLAAVMLSASPKVSDAKAIWLSDIWVRYNNDSARLMLGSAIHATDGFDGGGYDLYTTFMQGSPVMAYFDHTSWGLDKTYYWVDIKDTNLPKQWEFSVVATNVAPHTINWIVNSVPGTVTLTLTDTATGQSVDMRAVDSYTYDNTSSAPRVFTVAAGGSVVLPNMVAPDTNVTFAPGAYSGANVNISFSGTDDDTPVASLSYSVSIDGDAWSAPSQSTGVALNGLSEGLHTVLIKAIDASGNEDLTPVSVSFTVDTVSPVLAVGTAVSDNPYSASANVAEKNKNYVIVSGSSADAALSKVEYTLEDEYGQYTSSGVLTLSGDGTFSLPLRLRFKANKKDADGVRTYTLTVKSSDKAGNVNIYKADIK